MSVWVAIWDKKKIKIEKGGENFFAIDDGIYIYIYTHTPLALNMS